MGRTIKKGRAWEGPCRCGLIGGMDRVD